MKQKLEQYSYAIKKRNQNRILQIIFTVLCVFIFLNLILSFLIFPVRQTSVSMEPDISPNSFVFVTPLHLKVKRGDVVLIKPRADIQLSFGKKILNLFVKFFTAQQINLENNNDFPGTQNELRRVVALPGDTYYLRDYVLYIKPQGEKHFLTEFELIDKKYDVTFSQVSSVWDSTIGVKGFSEEVVLGEDEYLLLGDNRKAAADSRLWGPVSLKNIKAKALISYFPFNKIKTF